MEQASAATSKVSSSAQDAGKKASASLGSGLVTAAKAGATALTAATAAATALGVSAFKTGVSYNALQQSSRAALTTILKSSMAANAQMDKLDAFAKNSPFAKQVFIQAQQQLLGFGLEAEKVIPALDAIQNSVAAVGGSNEDIGNVTDALAKMLGQGKLAGDTLNRLGMYGIDAASIIGESMGKTGVEIREMASKPGGIPAGEVWDALINGLDAKFGGAAANVKKTWAGATDRIKGAWRDMGSALAEPFVGHKGGGLAIEWVNKFADLLRAIEKQVGPLVTALLPKFSGAFSNITPLLERATAAVKGLDASKFADGIGKVAKVAPGVASVAASILAMGGNSLGLEKIGLKLNPLVAGLVALVAASPEGRKAVGDLLAALSPLVPVAADLAKVLAGSLTVGVQGLASGVSAITPGISLLAQGVGLLADGFKALPAPVQTVVGALAAARIAMALAGTEA
ncbi:MAG TPA: tape measure protein, partial [Solirubrobacteraceae bacterium]|nr:tape measure protein [Solirubrobacteraceae bacterium]